MKSDEILITPTDQPPVNIYDDGNIPAVDLPQNKNSANTDYDNAEPLPESSRPRKDGPGGD